MTLGAFTLLMLALVGLGIVSYAEDRRDPSIAQQLASQRDAVQKFMNTPFEPEESPGSLKAANTVLADPLRARGKAIYEAESCNVCHGDDGLGTGGGLTLAGVGATYPSGGLARILKTPTRELADAGMMPLDIPDADLSALVAYVDTLK